MNRIYTLTLVLITSLTILNCSNNQDSAIPAGSEWQGRLTVPAVELPLTLHLSGDESEGFSGVIDNPSEDDFNRPINAVTFSNGELRLRINSLAVFFKGELSPNGDSLSGHWIRGRNRVPLTFVRQEKGSGISGSWTGTCIYPGESLNILLKFDRSWGGLNGTVDIPVLEVKQVPLEDITAADSTVNFKSAAIGANFSGKIEPDSTSFQGQWRWHSPAVPLDISFERVDVNNRATSQLPEMVNDGWRTGVLENPAAFDSLFHHVETGKLRDLHSVLVIKDERIVLEKYWRGFDRESRHDLRSATTAITSLLTGIALEREIFSGIDQPVWTLLAADSAYKNPDPRKSAISVRHLLTMTAGLTCDDFSKTAFGNETKMLRGADWVQIMLDLPQAFEPGKEWAYCAGGAMLLGAAISSASGRDVPAFAETSLFGPLGISDYRWQFSPEGRAYTGGLLMMRPRDLAKVGQLMLNDGKWQAEQIVSPQWIADATADQATTWGPEAAAESFGYLWWRKTFGENPQTTDGYFALGNGGQFLGCFPDKGLVVVLTGGDFRATHADQVFDIVENYILPVF